MKTKPIEALKLIDETESIVREIEIEAVTKLFASLACKLAFKEGQYSPKIKKLEWEEYRDCLVATTPFYNVSIKEVCGIYELVTAYSAFIKSYNSLDEAKAAAQADFEKRVKECLE